METIDSLTGWDWKLNISLINSLRKMINIPNLNKYGCR